MVGIGRKSRQLIDRDIKDGKLPQGYGFCRKCQTIKTEVMFSKATDSTLDSNNLLSVCKSCVDEIYLNVLESENGNIAKTILTLCRMLNVRFEQSAIDAALKHIETKQSDSNKVFGLYRAKLLVLFRTSMGDTNIDLTYQYNDNNIVTPLIDEKLFDKEENRNMIELRRFWGKNFDPEEILILEGKFSDWSKSHSIDTQSERVLLKFICLKEYEIDQAVEAKTSTASLMKEFQDLLKTSALSPNSSSALNGGKSMDAFGVWLADIMQFRPEEWVEDKSIYKDVDNIEAYGEKFITSPMRALVTGSREFSLDADEIQEEDSEGE